MATSIRKIKIQNYMMHRAFSQVHKELEAAAGRKSDVKLTGIIVQDDLGQARSQRAAHMTSASRL